MIGRRWFVRAAPAAPLAASVAASELNAKLLTGGSGAEPMRGGLSDLVTGNLARSESDVVRRPPLNWDKYRNAERQFDRAREIRYAIRNNAEEGYQDLNIRALRSVSPQHKAHMQWMMDQRRRQEERSFLDKLKDTLGLRGWFDSLPKIADTFDEPNFHPPRVSGDWKL